MPCLQVQSHSGILENGTSTEEFNCILDTVEEQIGELEERWVENFQFERQEKMIENTE